MHVFYFMKLSSLKRFLTGLYQWYLQALFFPKYKLIVSSILIVDVQRQNSYRIKDNSNYLWSWF